MRVMVYDVTERSRNRWLADSWYWGARLYLARGKLTEDPEDDFDTCKGVRSFEEMVRWLLSLNEPIEEIQYWGHGWFGTFAINRRHYAGNVLKEKKEGRENSLYPLLVDLKEQLTEESLWWFRTCCTFGTDAGQEFAEAWVSFFDCKVAGHTYAIGPWQAGLHTLSPGEKPSDVWSAREGWSGQVASPTPRMSMPWSPHCIFATRGDIPRGW